MHASDEDLSERIWVDLGGIVAELAPGSGTAPGPWFKSVCAINLLLLHQYALAGFYATATVLTAMYTDLPVTGRGGVVLVMANPYDLVGIISTTLNIGIDTGFLLFGLAGLVCATLAEWISRWVRWPVSAACPFVFVLLFFPWLPGGAAEPGRHRRKPSVGHDPAR